MCPSTCRELLVHQTGKQRKIRKYHHNPKDVYDSANLPIHHCNKQKRSVMVNCDINKETTYIPSSLNALVPPDHGCSSGDKAL